MFRAKTPPSLAQEKFRQAAEAFLQHVDFTDDELPWALILFNTMGAMIEENAKQHYAPLQQILSKKILEDVEFVITEGKYANNEHCAAFATAIRSYINYLNQYTPADGATLATANTAVINAPKDPAEGAASLRPGV